MRRRRSQRGRRRPEAGSPEGRGDLRQKLKGEFLISYAWDAARHGPRRDRDQGGLATVPRGAFVKRTRPSSRHGRRRVLRTPPSASGRSRPRRPCFQGVVGCGRRLPLSLDGDQLPSAGSARQSWTPAHSRQDLDQLVCIREPLNGESETIQYEACCLVACFSAAVSWTASSAVRRSPRVRGERSRSQPAVT